MTTLPYKPIESSVAIQRSLEEVFTFYEDFQNLPRFLGDVMQVEITGPFTSRWTIEGPLGVRLHWNAEVTEKIPNQRIRYQIAGSNPAKAVWTVSFERAADPKATIVHETLDAPMDRIERGLMDMIGKNPAAEVQANLQRLKEWLETGRITDTSYAVHGKFDAGSYPPPKAEQP